VNITTYMCYDLSKTTQRLSSKWYKWAILRTGRKNLRQEYSPCSTRRGRSEGRKYSRKLFVPSYIPYKGCEPDNVEAKDVRTTGYVVYE